MALSGYEETTVLQAETRDCHAFNLIGIGDSFEIDAAGGFDPTRHPVLDILDR